MGYWFKHEGNENRGTISDIGSFVTGGDLFNDNNMPIEGEANYQGLGIVISFDGNSIYYSGNNTNNPTWNNNVIMALGDSSLSVDFGTGIISGTISNFLGSSTKPNQNPTEGRLQDLSGELILNNAKIGNSHSGFFEGNLTGTLEGRTYKGLYGGQFYGNNESDGKPGTVAGTLGGVSSDGQFTITGFWMGDK